MTKPLRGEVWRVRLTGGEGHEQLGQRPALVLSVDQFNHGPADLVIVLPVTSKNKNIAAHVLIDPPEGGLQLKSYLMCDQVRTISQTRLMERLGLVTDGTMSRVEIIVKYLLGL